MIDHFKPFVDKTKKEGFISTIRGEFGDWVVFIIPDKNRSDGFQYGLFKYPSLEWNEIGDTLYDGSCADWYDWISKKPLEEDGI